MLGIHCNWLILPAGKCTHYKLQIIEPLCSERISRKGDYLPFKCSSTLFIYFTLQQLLHTLLLALAAIISASILTALQFPLSSPAAALAFAIVTTFSLGTIAAITGEELAPLPLFAVFLVSRKANLLRNA